MAGTEALEFDDRLALATTEASIAYVRARRSGPPVTVSALLDIAERNSVEAPCFDGVRGRSDFHAMAEALFAWAREADDEELTARGAR